MEKDLDKILLFVKEMFTSQKDYPTKDNVEIFAFLESLRGSKKISCKRLLVCIGIDFKKYSKSLDPKSGLLGCFTEALRIIILDIKDNPLIKSYKNGAVPPSIQFAVSLKNKDCFFLSKPFIKSDEKESYFRVTTFNSFFRHVINSNLITNPSLKNKVRKDPEPNELNFYYWKLKKKKRFHELNISALGSYSGWVFIASFKDLEKYIKNKNIDFLVDSLGFYTKNINKTTNYVSLQYPKENFFEPTYQPHCLTGDWGKIDGFDLDFGNDFFLSDGENNDRWGRTRSVSGDAENQKERAHLHFNYSKSNLSYKFSIDALGKLKSEIKQPNFDEILSDAITRFKKT